MWRHHRGHLKKTPSCSSASRRTKSSRSLRLSPQIPWSWSLSMAFVEFTAGCHTINRFLISTLLRKTLPCSAESKRESDLMSHLHCCLYCRLQRTLGTLFAPGVSISPWLFAVTHDAKLVLSGGHWDNSLCVYSVPRSKTIASIVRHNSRLLAHELTVSMIAFFQISSLV